jgi:hypothetical protein
MNNQDKIILSLFDYSGNWCRPYRENGYTVIQHDQKLGWDIFEDTIPAASADSIDGLRIHGLLAAPPCTDFARSGGHLWTKKDEQPAPYESKDVEFDNRLDYYQFMVYSVLAIVEWLQPKWWVIENPIGRIYKVVPELAKYRLLTFDPWEFGDPYSKKTVLYGEFNPWLTRNPVKPIKPTKGSHSIDTYYQIKGHKNRAVLRSTTPMGFAWAFYHANP